jgi:hypothetical protein
MLKEIAQETDKKNYKYLSFSLLVYANNDFGLNNMFLLHVEP